MGPADTISEWVACGAIGVRRRTIPHSAGRRSSLRALHDRQAATNPVIVFEVLSPSSEGDDDGEKRRDFQSLPSLRAYVLVHQDQRLVRVYRRTERGGWIPDAQTRRDDDRVELPTLGDAFPLSEIYTGILDEQGRSLLRG